MLDRSRGLTPNNLALIVTGAAFLVACASAPAASAKKKRTPADPGDDFFADDVTAEQDGLSPTPNEDSGAFGASARPAPPGADDDGGAPIAPPDAGPAPKVLCAGALQAGDLEIDELLITSRAGSGDDGEWVEIRSTRACWLRLQGLSIESPRGTVAPNVVSITEDFELAPGGNFVVADSLDPGKNHGLTGKVFAWGASDVLKNDGDTVVLRAGAVVVDSLTFPAFSNLEPGRSIAFPSDCPAGTRSDWDRWSLTFAAYAPGFEGTPNSSNDDVACY